MREEEYYALSVEERLAHLEKIVGDAGICRMCGQHYSHDIAEPFADCGCGTSEWYKLTPYMKLERKIFLAHTAPLPPLPEPVTFISGTPYFSWSQISDHASDTRELIVQHLGDYPADKSRIHLKSEGNTDGRFDSHIDRG